MWLQWCSPYTSLYHPVPDIVHTWESFDRALGETTVSISRPKEFGDSSRSGPHDRLEIGFIGLHGRYDQLVHASMRQISPTCSANNEVWPVSRCQHQSWIVRERKSR